MHDPSAFSTDAPAPRVLFDRLEGRESHVRYVTRADDHRETTWGEHARGVENTARALVASGFSPGDRAAVFAPNCVEWMEAALGIQAAGGVMVPIYASNTAEQAAYVLDHSDAAFVFVGSDALAARVAEARRLSKATYRVVCLPKTRGVELENAEAAYSWDAFQELGAESGSEGAFRDRLHGLKPSDGAVMLYTSGTSGNPKGVPLTHRNVGANGIDWLAVFHPLVEVGDVDVLWLPFSHVFGFGEAAIGNNLGWTSHLATPADALVAMPQVRPTVFMSVPAYWEKLAVGAQARLQRGAATATEALADLTGGRLRFCLSGGAGLKIEVKEFFREAGLLIMEGYGLTECSPTLTLNRPDDYRFDSVGKPLPSVELKLAADGEILAKGENVFSGYHKAPEATAEAFDGDGWFKTGDVGRWTDDGFLQIIDRKKDILVTAGGKNIPPANIERLFQDDPFIAHLVVYGEGKKFLSAGVWPEMAAVESRLGRAPTSPLHEDTELQELVAERIALANERLPKHEQLRAFRVVSPPLSVEGGLLTPTLKVKRKKVWETFREQFEGMYV